MPIPEVVEIDASSLLPSSQRLELLFSEIQKLIKAEKRGNKGLFTIAINYLEDFSGLQESSVQAFFRDVNGLLRTYPALILWPVTQEQEARGMVNLASNVSSTVFAREPILEFSGPSLAMFPRIAKQTISILNPGLSFDDFQLTENDFDESAQNMMRRYEAEQTIRNYLKDVKAEWEARSGAIQNVLRKIPKFTEVWFVVCFLEAENIVSQFARKSLEADLAWDADIRKFSEYVTGNTQRAADWDQRRLMQAFQGYFKTKILFIPTHTLVACVAAYGKDRDPKSEKTIVDQNLLNRMIEQFSTKDWRNKKASRRLFDTSPLAYQLKGVGSLPGQRRGTSKSVENARESFLILNRYISSSGEGSDQPINKALALAIQQAMNLKNDEISAERFHPWLGPIRPDILVDNNPEKTICIEMFYTAEARPYSVAYYVLRKMSVYMKQIEAYMKQPKVI